MAMENISKRKCKDKNRNFQEEWFENYGFIDNKKSSCLICNTTIKNYKVAIHMDIMKQIIPTFQLNIHSIQNYKPRNLNLCNLVFLNKDS